MTSRPRNESATLSPEGAPPAKKIMSDMSSHLCPTHARLLQVARDSYEPYRKALEEAETADQQAEEEVNKLTQARTERDKTATAINRKEKDIQARKDKIESIRKSLVEEEQKLRDSELDLQGLRSLHNTNNSNYNEATTKADAAQRQAIAKRNVVDEHELDAIGQVYNWAEDTLALAEETD